MHGYCIDIEEATKYRGQIAEVSAYLPDRDSDMSITVYGPRKQHGEVVPARVNWSGIGSCSATDALVYADLLRFCAKLAPTLLGPVDA